MSHQRIIGIAGSFASGKDTLADRLVDDLGFVHYSLGDMVRKVAFAQRGSTERPILHEVADTMRRQHGGDYFMQLALQEGSATQAPGVIVTGIRTMGEANAIIAAGGQIVFIDAPAQVRYDRMRARQRDNETQLTLQQFIKNEETEWYAGPADTDFNLRGIKQIASATLQNTTGPDEFFARAKQSLGL
jgi:dephospho-CoA kinase